MSRIVEHGYAFARGTEEGAFNGSHDLAAIAVGQRLGGKLGFLQAAQHACHGAHVVDATVERRRIVIILADEQGPIGSFDAAGCWPYRQFGCRGEFPVRFIICPAAEGDTVQSEGTV